MSICHHCYRELPAEGKIGRDDVCPHCRSDVKCCLNCRFYNERAHNKCDEPVAEFVGLRDRSNFCEFFELNRSATAADHNRQERARTAFDDLFK